MTACAKSVPSCAAIASAYTGADESSGGPGAKAARIKTGARYDQESAIGFSQRSLAQLPLMKSGTRPSAPAAAISTGTYGSGSRSSIGITTSCSGTTNPMPNSKRT